MGQKTNLKAGSLFQRRINKICVGLPARKGILYQDLIEGKRALEITRDIVFKKVFDPDVHPDRLSRFLSLILGFDIEVVGSSKNESMRDSIFDKGIIMDVNAKVKGGENIIVEMQVDRQEFLGKRAAVISASSLKSQYSAMKLGRKRTMQYDMLKKVYTIFIMVDSPSFFKGSKGSIHFYKQTSETGPELDLLQEYLFVELKDYLTDGALIENEVDAWLAFLATDSIETRNRIVNSYPVFKEIDEEVQSMLKSPKFLQWLFRRDMQDDTRYSELMQSKREGRDEGIKEGIKEGGLKLLLTQIKKGYITDEAAIRESAQEFGYTLEEINKMLSEGLDKTNDKLGKGE